MTKLEMLGDHIKSLTNEEIKRKAQNLLYAFDISSLTMYIIGACDAMPVTEADAPILHAIKDLLS